MKLELGRINVKSVKFGDKTEIKDGALTVCCEECIKKLVLEDDRIKSVKIDIAHPGEKTRSLSRV